MLQRLIFMKPAIWWEDYAGRMENVRWVRTCMGDVVPCYLVKTTYSNPEFTIIYSHGNASDMVM